uniref:U3 small nucleolar RNA-associated protein NOL7 C-terminal domain-containing protein n=1 Tax=Scophthalmus maximus TaxID=52904 RepID=A0A8D3DVW9_SCOMX
TAARWFLPVPWSYSTQRPSHCSGARQGPAAGGEASDLGGLLLESSDDEAPEEVTFEDSKTQALRSMKDALDTVRREKEQLKEKRRRRQELFQEQKVCVLAPSTDQSDHKTNSFRVNWTPSCFSLKGNYTVATVKERSSATFQQQVAQDFIQSRLYGPGSCRTTNNELLSLQNKKGRNQSAAVQFVKKDWGEFSPKSVRPC